MICLKLNRKLQIHFTLTKPWGKKMDGKMPLEEAGEFSALTTQLSD